MDGFETDLSAAGGPGQADCNSAPAEVPNGNAADASFHARAEQWRSEALRHPDSRQACIGAINAGTAGIIHRQQTAIEHAIKSSKKTLLEDSSIQSGIGALAGLTRQLKSLLDFEVRLEQIRRNSEKLEAQRQMDPLRRTAR